MHFFLLWQLPCGYAPSVGVLQAIHLVCFFCFVAKELD